MRAKRGLLSQSSISLVICLVILTVITPSNVNSINYETNSNQISDCEQLICLAAPNDLILEKITVRIQLNTYAYAITHFELVIRNQGSEAVNNVAVWLNGSFTSFTLNDPFGELNYNLLYIAQSFLLNISLRNPLATNQSFLCFIQTSWDLAKLTNERPFYFHVEIPLILPMETELLSLVLFLPPNNFLIDDPLKINPVDNAVIMGDVNQMAISWFINSPDSSPNAPLVFSAKYTDGREEKPVEESNFFEKLLPILTIAFIGGLLYYAANRWQEKIKNRGKTTSQDFNLQLLKEDEIQLLEFIKQNGGRIDQKELETVSNFSRSKLSRHLFILEEKGLIEKIQFGRTNRILLTKEALSNLSLSDPENLVDEE